MAAPAFNETYPDYGSASALSVQMDAVRDNTEWLMIAAAAAGYLLPGWTTTVNTPGAEPAFIEMVKGTRKMKWTFTWTSGNLTGVVWAFDRGLGAGYETLTGGTLTLTYDGGNNFTGATAA